MRNFSAFAGKVLILFAAFVLTACGSARLGYQNGELISYWWLNSYIDIDADQSPVVMKNLTSLFDWHHKTQLLDYAQFLMAQQSRLQRTVTKNDMIDIRLAVRSRVRLLADRALPELADLALSLQPQQILHLEKKFASNDDTYRKDSLSADPEKRQRFRFKKALQQAEYWFGDFSREQERQIRIASDARPLNNELMMADRLQRQREMVLLLRKIYAQKPSRENTIALLKEYMSNSYFERPNLRPELREYFEASRESSAQMEAVIANLATPEQKAQAITRAQQWINDFNALAEGPE
jgi:hypothetical protein